MKISSVQQSKINKAKNYVNSGYTINRTFLIVGIIEAVLLGMGLFYFDILNFWLLLLLLGGTLFATYVVYIMFAMVISMLEQLSLNNELLAMVLEKEVSYKAVSDKTAEKNKDVNLKKNLSILKASKRKVKLEKELAIQLMMNYM